MSDQVSTYGGPRSLLGCRTFVTLKFLSYRIMQPPGGSSNLFGEAEDGGEEEAKAPAAKKPDRWEIS